MQLNLPMVTVELAEPGPVRLNGAFVDGDASAIPLPVLLVADVQLFDALVGEFGMERVATYVRLIALFGGRCSWDCSSAG